MQLTCLTNANDNKRPFSLHFRWISKITFNFNSFQYMKCLIYRHYSFIHRKRCRAFWKQCGIHQMCLKIINRNLGTWVQPSTQLYLSYDRSQHLTPQLRQLQTHSKPPLMFSSVRWVDQIFFNIFGRKKMSPSLAKNIDVIQTFQWTCLSFEEHLS